jgi:hypothetical protein
MTHHPLFILSLPLSPPQCCRYVFCEADCCAVLVLRLVLLRDGMIYCFRVSLLSMFSLSTLWFVVVFTRFIFLFILSCYPSLPFAPFLHEVVLALSLAPSMTNNQPRQDLRDVGCYRAQSRGVYDYVCQTPSDFRDRRLRGDATHPMTL